MLADIQRPPQNSGDEPWPVPLSPPHPLSPPVETVTHRLHLPGSLPSPQPLSQQIQPESLLLPLTVRPGLSAFLLPFLQLWKSWASPTPTFQGSAQMPPPPGCLLRLAPPMSAVLHTDLVACCLSPRSLRSWRTTSSLCLRCTLPPPVLVHKDFRTKGQTLLKLN